MHANDMLNASWWDDPAAKHYIYNNIPRSEIGGKITQWMEIKASWINYQNTGDQKFLNYFNENLKKW